MEIAPGPPMTFNGRVHANSNIYIRNDTSQFDSFLTTVGDVYRHLKREPGVRGSNPTIKDAGGTYRDLNFDHAHDQDFNNPWTPQDWRNAALTTFDGLVLDSAMGVQEIIPPIPELFYDPVNPEVISHQMIEKGDPADSPAMQAAKPYYEAQLRIEADVAGVITATDQKGDPVSLASCTPGTVSTQSFYDKREEATMTVTEVNIGALEACGKMPANGLLYVSREGTHQGVRLANGALLPDQGLTVVSENPVYIQGDYNTVNKKPAAVMGDAITVLSNNWGLNNSDTKGNQVTSNRPATATTVNAAFALGPSAESVEGQGNGQLENVIRFLENWTGKNFNYNGSIIALWHSQQATGDWRCCGNSGNHYYEPPNRNWAYDPLFNTHIQAGNRIFLINGGRWEPLTVQAVNTRSTPHRITTMTGAVDSYPWGSQVGRPLRVGYCWYDDPDADGIPAPASCAGLPANTLYRDQGAGAGWQPLVRHIRGLRFQYFDANDSATANPVDIRRIAITLTAQSPSGWWKPQTYNIAADVRPRNLP